MGVATAADLLKQGSELAGATYDANDTKLLTWLKQWLRSVALGWPWAETSRIEEAILAAGTHNLSVGFGQTYFADKYITRVDFPLKIMYGEDYLPGSIEQEAGIDSTVNTNNVKSGTPTKAAYKRGTTGVVMFTFNAKPTAPLTLQISYQYDPAVTMVDTDIPWYPNDNTIIHAIAHEVSKYHNGNDDSTTRALADSLSVMFRNDKLKFGNIENYDVKLSRKFAGK